MLLVVVEFQECLFEDGVCVFDFALGVCVCCLCLCLLFPVLCLVVILS